jgi:hypothetical protein
MEKLTGRLDRQGGQIYLIIEEPQSDEQLSTLEALRSDLALPGTLEHLRSGLWFHDPEEILLLQSKGDLEKLRTWVAVSDPGKLASQLRYGVSRRGP